MSYNADVTGLDINPLREKARATMVSGKLPKTIKEVENIVADPRTQPSGVCAVCDIAIEKGDFWFLVKQSGLTSTAIHRPMHWDCHAAWQLEVRGMPKS